MTLIDTGPLVASIATRDPNHHRTKSILQTVSYPLDTTSSCVAEAMYFLGNLGRAAAQCELIDMIMIGELRFDELTSNDLPRIRELILKYANVPMDYADATLIVTAEKRRHKSIFTFDSDFRIYRLADGSALQIIPE